MGQIFTGVINYIIAYKTSQFNIGLIIGWWVGAKYTSFLYYGILFWLQKITDHYQQPTAV